MMKYHYKTNVSSSTEINVLKLQRYLKTVDKSILNRCPKLDVNNDCQLLIGHCFLQ